MISVWRFDHQHPLLRARHLLEFLVFHLLSFSLMSGYVLVVVVSSLVVSARVSGVSGFTQGFHARRSVTRFLLACPCSAL